MKSTTKLWLCLFWNGTTKLIPCAEAWSLNPTAVGPSVKICCFKRLWSFRFPNALCLSWTNHTQSSMANERTIVGCLYWSVPRLGCGAQCWGSIWRSKMVSDLEQKRSKRVTRIPRCIFSCLSCNKKYKSRSKCFFHQGVKPELH